MELTHIMDREISRNMGVPWFSGCREWEVFRLRGAREAQELHR